MAGIGEMQYEPLGKELENLVLAFLGKPSLSGDIQFDLMKVHLHDLGRKRCRKVLCELSVFSLKRAGELRRVAEPVTRKIQVSSHREHEDRYFTGGTVFPEWHMPTFLSSTTRCVRVLPRRQEQH